MSARPLPRTPSVTARRLPWRLLAPLGAALFTLSVAALLIAAAGAPPLPTLALLADSAFGSRLALTETLVRATPLILTGLAAAVAFRARLWNIGAEGQLYAGALATAFVGGQMADALAGLPAPLWLALVLASAMLAGALLLLAPVLLRMRFGVDEVVTTLLLNFVALLAVSAMLEGPMKDPMAMGWPQSVAVAAELEYTKIVDRSRLHAGLLVALAAAALVWAVNRHTAFGFAMRATGANPVAARFAGLPVGAATVGTALLSGALAGLAGAGEVLGRTGYLTLDMSPGYGWAGIVIAMLAGLHPLAVVAAAVGVAGVFVGADGMSRAAGVPTFLADLMVAVALLATLVAAHLSRRAS